MYHKFIDSLLLLKSLKLLNHPTTTTNLSLTTTITTTQQEEFNNIQEHLSILIKWVINENQTITSKVIKSFPKNYYAWTYLLYIAQSLKDLALASCYTTSNVISCGNIRKEEARNVTVIVGQVQIFLTMQVSFVVPWLQRHVSDHSASHYGSMVLRMLITFMLEVANKCENNVNYKKNTNGVDATKTPPLEKNDQVLQNLQHYGGTTKKKKEAAVECVLRIIEQELRKVGELLQLYPSHEALWLYRRQCSIIFLDVVHKELTVLGRGISASKLQYCTASDVHIMLRDCLRNFFQKEISFVLSNDDTATTKKSQQPQSLEDGVNIKFHQLTYIAWIYYHVRRNGLNEELAKHCNQKGDWEEKQFEKMRGVVTRLQSIDSIPHNLWRHSSLL